jgi:hypothetical protein
MTRTHAERVHAVLNSRSTSFLELAELAGLNPAKSFRHANLRNLDLSGLDLTGFDFTGADMTGVKLDGAKTIDAIFTDTILDGPTLPIRTILDSAVAEFGYSFAEVDYINELTPEKALKYFVEFILPNRKSIGLGSYQITDIFIDIIERHEVTFHIIQELIDRTISTPGVFDHIHLFEHFLPYCDTYDDASKLAARCFPFVLNISQENLSIFAFYSANLDVALGMLDVLLIGKPEMGVLIALGRRVESIEDFSLLLKFVDLNLAVENPVDVVFRIVADFDVAFEVARSGPEITNMAELLALKAKTIEQTRAVLNLLPNDAELTLPILLSTLPLRLAARVCHMSSSFHLKVTPLIFQSLYGRARTLGGRLNLVRAFAQHPDISTAEDVAFSDDADLYLLDLVSGIRLANGYADSSAEDDNRFADRIYRHANIIEELIELWFETSDRSFEAQFPFLAAHVAVSKTLEGRVDVNFTRLARHPARDPDFGALFTAGFSIGEQ